MARITFGDVCGSPATPPERALSVAASCSLRELPRLRSRASRIADPLARARSAAFAAAAKSCAGTYTYAWIKRLEKVDGVKNTYTKRVGIPRKFLGHS